MYENNSDKKWYLLKEVDSRIKWILISIFVLSVAFLIAGSVMLGIGISKLNQTPVFNQLSAYTIVLKTESKDVPYASVVTNYTNTVQLFTDQLNQVLNPLNMNNRYVIRDSIVDSPITILGISNSSGKADVLFAMSYTDSKKPNLEEIQTKVEASSTFYFLSVSDKTASSLDNMECAVVSITNPTTTTSTTRTISSATPSQTSPTSTASSHSSVQPSSSSSSNPVTESTPTTSHSLISTTTSGLTASSQDIIILLDDSRAIGSKKAFEEVKSWILNSLLKRWKIDPENVQIAFVTYATTDFNLILYYNEQTNDDASSAIKAQNYYGEYAPSITDGIRGASNLKPFRAVNQTTILISASENLTDIENAIPFANQLKTFSKQLITVALNSTTNGKQLGLISTSQTHYFGSSNFTLTDETAQRITDYIFGFSSTTTTIPLTTQNPVNDCHSDITLLIDCSNDVGSVEEFNNELKFVVSLVKTWDISQESVESEAVFFSTKESGQIVENAFNYQSAKTFANELMQFKNYYFEGSPASISETLQFLSQNLNNRRLKRQQTVILFTYSSNIDDVQNAIQFSDEINSNLIIVGLSNANATILTELSGNVVYSKNLSSTLISNINNLICTQSTRLPSLPTTVSSLTTTLKPTTGISASTSTQKSPTTTAFVSNCSDCIPKTSNILLLLEAYKPTLDSQINLTAFNLANNWNHFSRVSVLGFNTKTKYEDLINFGDLNDLNEYQTIIENIVPMDEKPILSSAFYLANILEKPLVDFGNLNSVIFTTGTTSDDILNALPLSKKLREKGKVIIVAMNFENYNDLIGLCDNLLLWNDLSNFNNISEKINNILNQ